MAKIDLLLRDALQRKASDLHLSAEEPVRARVDGDLVCLNPMPIPAAEVKAILYELMNEAEREKFVNNKNLDKSYMLENIGFFRVNIFQQRKGMAAVLRTIPRKIPTHQELGLPDSVVKFTELPKGLVLVTGPTGSGKSTTLASMIHHINLKYQYHVLTIEDPIEFVHESRQSLINQREIGNSCHTFADALKYALREDPDVILVGEMRDLETMALALTAAETGHLVFGTLHTRGAGASVDRIIDSFPANQQAMIRTMLSESLAGVISQALLKRCDQGGRVAAYEILVVNHAVANLIREGKTFQIPSIIQTGKKDGMVLMDQCISELVDKGIVDPEEGMSYMENPESVRAKTRSKPRRAQQNNLPGGTIPNYSSAPKEIPGGTVAPSAPAAKGAAPAVKGALPQAPAKVVVPPAAVRPVAQATAAKVAPPPAAKSAPPIASKPAPTQEKTDEFFDPFAKDEAEKEDSLSFNSVEPEITEVGMEPTTGSLSSVSEVDEGLKQNLWSMEDVAVSVSAKPANEPSMKPPSMPPPMAKKKAV